MSLYELGFSRSKADDFYKIASDVNRNRHALRLNKNIGILAQES